MINHQVIGLFIFAALLSYGVWGLEGAITWSLMVGPFILAIHYNVTKNLTKK